jgi:DNA-binding transcriptional LysR family regulator
LIKEMESRVGFRLFDCTTRHVELTPHGRELLAVIQRSLQELDTTIANIGRSAKHTQQPLSLGTTPLVAANILAPAMREFRKQRPDVRIQLFDADLPTLIQMVEAGKLDMSLGIFKAMPDVRREPFFRFSLMVARAAQDNIQPRRTTTWSALEGETLISLSAGHPHQQASRASRCEGADRIHRQPARHADCPGRSRGRDCHHSLIRDAGVLQPKGGEELHCYLGGTRRRALNKSKVVARPFKDGADIERDQHSRGTLTPKD